VSDTPRADAVDAKCNELELGDAIFYAIFHFEKLERELNAANDRIKRLESENDALRADLLLWNEKEVKL
jgi:predicted nuclease with TOPRIM domain